MSCKIDREGNYIPFPGITVVASASASSPNIALWDDVYKGLHNNSTVREYFSLLPVDSYHMTTINLYTEAETNGDWNEFVDSRLDWLQRLDLTMRENDFSPVVVPHDVVFSGVIMLLLKLNDKQNQAIHALAGDFNVTASIPPVYHISIGYRKKQVPNDIHEQLSRDFRHIFNSAFEKHRCGQIELAPARLCYFQDMTKFVPWDGTENPFVVRTEK